MTHVSESVRVAPVALSSDELEAMYIGLVRTYQRAILSYLYSLVADIQQAEDLAQDTFLRAYLGLPKVGMPDNPRAWLFKIATNVTIDHLRRRRRIGWVSLNSLTHVLRDRDVYADIETKDPVSRALAALSPDDQTVLMLFAEVGLKAPEVAEVLGISPAAARKRRQRAREAFTRAYQKESA
jgi:RNA polymerase sigma-70 factor (ECF subfamily)